MIKAFLLKFWKPLVGIAVVALLFGGVLYYGHQKKEEGRSEIQAKWDKEKAIQKLAYEKQQRKVAELEQTLELAEWKRRHEYEPRLKALDKRNSELASRLRHYFASAGLPAETSPSELGDGEEPGGGETSEADRLLTDYDAECRKTALKHSYLRERELESLELPVIEPLPTPDDIIKRERERREAIFGVIN